MVAKLWLDVILSKCIIVKYNLECSASLFIVKVRSNKILTFRMSEDFVFKHHCTVPTLGLQAYIPIFEYGLFLEVHS